MKLLLYSISNLVNVLTLVCNSTSEVEYTNAYV